MKLKDIVLEAQREVKPADLKRVRQKVFNDLKRKLKVWMNKPTLQGEVEFAVAKALKLRVIDIRGGSFNVPIENTVADLAADLHKLVVQMRKKSGDSFVNIYE